MSEFNKVLKILHFSDALIGNYVFKSDQKLSLWQQIHRWLWIPGFTLPLVLIISTVIVHFDNFSLVLQCIVMFQLYLASLMMNTDMLMKKDLMLKIMDWCTKTQGMNNVHMNNARILMAKTIKWLAIFFAASLVSITIGMIIIGQVLPEEVYPRFRPPLPFELPLENRDNWLVYIITCVMQCCGIFYGQVFACLYYSFFFIFCTIFYAYLNTILDDLWEVKDMTWAQDGGKMKFKVKMDNIAKKYCAGLEIFKIFSEQTSFFILTTEWNCFIAFLYTGLLVLTNNENLFSSAIPTNVISVFFFLLCLLNDRLQTRLDNVFDAIYDLPWYNYTISQRKHFLMVLQCNQIKMKLRGGGLYPVSLQLYSTIFRNSYSTILVIKKTLELQK